MNCPKCGQQIDDTQSRFCPKCGNDLQQIIVGNKPASTFCRNCGKQLVGKPDICMNCGARPMSGNSYCPACGSATNVQAVICVKCGAGLELKPAIVNEPQTNNQGKSKTASVLLAVFLAFWTWLYTYKKDTWKFWVGLGLAILSIILAISTFGISLAFTWIIGLGIWIWAIVDTAVKDNKWYSSY